MNILTLLLEIIQIAASVATGSLKGDLTIADAIVTIVQKGIQAYQAQTGQPIDPALIKPFEPIP